jgi:hypothetical protein
MSKTKIKWHKQPQKHDYPAARAYLNLILQPRHAKKIVEKLKRAAQVQEFAAKDVLRAANVPLLTASDGDVQKERSLIRHKKALSPLLLYRDPLSKLIIADGYHRLCAVYSFDSKR